MKRNKVNEKEQAKGTSRVQVKGNKQRVQAGYK